MKLSDIQDDFSSHIPVLEGIPKLFSMRKVLELGSGRLSTPLFLDRMTYPDLFKLVSIENDKNYGEELLKTLAFDSRLEYKLVNGLVAEAVAEIDLNDFDLCLIDDSTTVEDRVNTIRTITNKPNHNCIIVIHDFEHEQYKQAVNDKYLPFCVDSKLPHTGLAFSDDNEWFLQLMDLIR